MRDRDRQTMGETDRDTDRALAQHVFAPAVPGGRSTVILAHHQPLFALEPRRHRLPSSRVALAPEPPPRPIWRWAQAPYLCLPRHGHTRTTRSTGLQTLGLLSGLISRVCFSQPTDISCVSLFYRLFLFGAER